MSWIAIVPVKGGPNAKSRLGDLAERAHLAQAFALDTVEALLSARAVERVFVVTAAAGAAFAARGADVVPERAVSAHSGFAPLNGAVMQGIEAARAAAPRANLAVFTGDLPALAPEDVDEALRLAGRCPRSMVPDEEGTGTTALLALAGERVTPRFGPGSRAAHEADGHVPLSIPVTARIRRDVDTRDDLAEALRLGLGPRTRALAEAALAASPVSCSAVR